MNQAQFLSDKTLSTRWGVHRATVWEWVKQGRVPAPVKLSNRCTRWKLADIQAWEAQQGGAQ